MRPGACSSDEGGNGGVATHSGCSLPLNLVASRAVVMQKMNAESIAFCVCRLSVSLSLSHSLSLQHPKRGPKNRAYGTPDSHVVPHRSTDRACSGLTAQFGRDTVLFTEYGRRQPCTEITGYLNGGQGEQPVATKVPGSTRTATPAAAAGCLACPLLPEQEPHEKHKKKKKKKKKTNLLLRPDEIANSNKRVSSRPRCRCQLLL